MTPDSMNRLARAIPAAALAALIVVAGSAARGGAASRTACTLVPAAQASALFARPVTTSVRPAAVPTNSVCMYLSGGRPILQLGLNVMETEGVARTVFKMQQQAAAEHKNVGSRQKGNVVLSAITMNGDVGMLNALLNAAVKSL
jgi:hypothetical protein